MTKIDTRCIHAGYTPGKGEPRQIPIIQSTTFKYEDFTLEGYDPWPGIKAPVAV